MECYVNNELRQDENTNDLIFDIPYIISYLSEFLTLKTGDLIFTGTPAGVGATQGKLLKDGDVKPKVESYSIPNYHGDRGQYVYPHS